MNEQYQSVHNLSPINSISEPKIYDKDDDSYSNLFINSSITNYSYFKPTSTSLNSTENKEFNSYEDLLSPLSSPSSSSSSSVISLPLPSPTSLSKQNPLSNDLDSYENMYRYEPFSMIIPEPKNSCKEFTVDSNVNIFSNGNILLNPSIFYSTNKFERTWRYFVTWSILLSLLCHLDPLETGYSFITPLEYFFIGLTVTLLIFRIFIMFVQSNFFKSYVKCYNATNTTNTNTYTTTTTTTTTTNSDNPTHTETEQPQQEATVLNMERVDTRTHHENSAGFAKPKFCGGCRENCSNGTNCCSIRDNYCRYNLNYCIAGCLTGCCICCQN